MNIRGIGVLSDSNQPARDQGVGIYIDGVYMGRAQGLGTAIYDVENIEVLKGPQGTLFGRNTEGGAVNITTKKPSGQFKANMTAGFGNYGSYKGEVHLDLPAWHDIAVKIDGVVAHRDAMVKNPLQGQYGFNYYNKRGLHAEALWRAAPNFTADYAFDISYDASTPLYLQLTTPPTATTVKLAALGTVQPVRADTANVGVPQQLSIGKTWGHRLTLDWKVARRSR
jgi:iron complex outermembrane receptor protein